MGYKMNSKKRRIAIKGCCAFIASASPLTPVSYTHLEYNDLPRAKSFIEMLSQKEDFTKKLIEREDGVIVTIGEENADDIMNDCALITASYHVDGKLVGKIGVIGPTRMRYGEITSIVEYLTDNLSNTFKLESGGNEEDE